MESRIVCEMPLRSGAQLIIRKWGDVRILEMSNSEVYSMEVWLDKKDWERFVEEMKKVE